MSDRGWIKRVRAFVADDNLDPYVLALVGPPFTVLDITGLVGPDKLVTAVLALLAILAFSQIKSRGLTQRITSSRSGVVASRTESSADLIDRRAAASNILPIGFAMARTVQGMRTDRPGILNSGMRERVSVLAPTNDSLIEASDRRRLMTWIQVALDDLVALRERHSRQLEIRVLRSLNLSCLIASTAPYR
ncbi:hypothetical protein ACFWN2_04685 [Lentzea sp. NPDC058436]|uniref:hypothetical protein n=1 Tax=Lentzea sp. NPDC058436 TaxID=3346499 RepID=UPI003669E9AF